MTKIIGIDLGTTNSAVAVMEGATPTIIPTAEGDRLVPSIVAVDKNGQTLVGKLAKNQMVTNPENTIYSVKRFIGRRFEDETAQKDAKTLPYKIREGKNGSIDVMMNGEHFRPEEISAKVLQKIKRDAEAFLGTKITEAVITVPAYFNDSQRQATKDAGRIAGFEVKRILNEPTAAALAYGLNNKKEGKVAVFDFGGGTFDITILDIGDGVFEVLSTNGDTHLGGDDIDNIIIEYFVNEFKKESGIDLQKDKLALQRLKDAAQKAKHELSSTASSNVNIPFITADASGPKHFDLNFTRAKLEDLTKNLIDRVTVPCEKAMKDAGLTPNDITDVILVGGQTRMPAIEEKVRKIFGKEPNKSVNPDEAVAIGAAIQAGIIQGDVKDILLLDVTPLSLGIETLGGVSTTLIPRNTTIPTQKTQIFSTAADNQTSVEIHIVQGERERATDNKTLGRFILDGIPPAPRGMPQIEVSFDIDANGILSVSAKDLATKKEQKITIKASTGLSEDEIQRMVNDAKENEEKDKKWKKLIEVKNQAEQIIYQSEKTLSEMGEKVSSEIKKEVEEKLAKLKELIGTDDVEKSHEIELATSDLSKSLQKVGEEMYKNTGNQSQEQSQNSSNENSQEEEKSGAKEV